MDKAQIARINELAKKQRAEGLTEEEKREQAALRKEYLDAFRANLQATLDNVYIEREDGGYEQLKKKTSGVQ